MIHRSVLAKRFEQNYAKIYIKPILFVYFFFLIQSIQAQKKGIQKLFIEENSEDCQAHPKEKTTFIKPNWCRNTQIKAFLDQRVLNESEISEYKQRRF